MFQIKKNKLARLTWSRKASLTVGIISLLLAFPLVGTQRDVVQAAPSTHLNFQARLLGNSGAIVADGTYNVQFSIYSVSSGGTALWTETYLNSAGQGVTVKSGYLSVKLGSVDSLADETDINWNEQLWLSMTVRGTGSCAFGACTPADAEMSPRIQLTAVPFAFQAQELALTSGTDRGVLKFLGVTNDPIINLPNVSGTVCLDTNNCGFLIGTGNAFVQGGNDFNATAVLGTTDADALNIVTNGVTRLNVSATGSSTFTGGTSGVALTVNNSTSTDNILNLQRNGTSVASFDQFGRLEVAANGYTTTGFSEPLIQVAGPVTKDQTNESFYVINFDSDINVDVDPGLLGGDVFFRDNSSRIIDTDIDDNGGQVTFMSAPNLIGGGNFSVDLSGAVVGIHTGVFASTTGTSTLLIDNLIGGRFTANSVGAGVTITDRYGVKVENALGAGNVSTQYGLHIQDLTKGAVNHGIYVGGATNGHALWVDSGTTRLDGTLELQSLGATDTATYLCRNSSNQLAACSGAASGSAFVQGGNDFNATAVLGTTDADGLNIITSNVTRIGITSAGATTITGGTTGNPVALTVNNSTSTGSILALQDNGTPVFTVADGGDVTSTGNLDVAKFIAAGSSAAISDPVVFNANHSFDDTFDCTAGCRGFDATIRANRPTGFAGGSIQGLRLATGTDATSVGNAYTLANAIGLVIDGGSAGANAAITNNFGILINDQTKGAADYGLVIQGADSDAIWVQADNTRLDGNLIVDTNDNTLFVDSTSNIVGVGDATPDAKFDIDATFSPATTGTTTNTGSGLTVSNTVNKTAGSDTTYGQQIAVTRTGATGGTINTYGLDIQVTASTGGTSTATGLNVNIAGAADTNYAAIFQGGNVGIKNTAPANTLSINTPTTPISEAVALVAAASSNDKLMVLQAAAAHAENIFEVQNSAGNTIARVYLQSPGTDTLNATLAVRSNQAARPAFAFQGDEDTGIFSSGSNGFGITTGGTLRVNVDSNGRMGIGQANPDGRLELAGNMSQAAWGLNGIQLQASSATYTDTGTTGTRTNTVINSFGQPTLASTNAVTSTNASTVYIQGAPIASGNHSITAGGAYALWVDDGTARFDGNVIVGTLGSASNDTILCRNGSNQIASCTSSLLTSATAFVQGGNAFGATATLGTTDGNALNLVTGTGGPNTRLSISATGSSTFTGGTSGVALTVNGSTSTGNILDLQGNGTSVASVDKDGRLSLINNTFTPTGVSQPIIDVGGTITKAADLRSFYVVNFDSTVDVNADPGHFGGDVLFRDGSTRTHNTGTTTADTGGTATFFSAPTIRAENNSTVTVGSNFLFNAGITGLQTDMHLHGLSGSSLTVHNAYGARLGAASVGVGGDSNVTLVNRYGVKVENAGGTGAVTNQFGVQIDALAKGTNNAGVLIGEATGTNQANLIIGQTTIPTGSYSIYNSSTDQNYFAGNVGIGDASPAGLLTVGTSDAFQVDSSGNVTTTGIFSPRTASGTDLGSATLEFDELYLGDDTGLSLGLDQDATLVYDEATDDRVELKGTGASLFVEDRLSLGVQSVTITDNGITDTITPTSSYVRMIIDETANVGVPSLVLSETGVKDGDLLILVNNESDGTHEGLSLAASAGVTQLNTTDGAWAPTDAAGEYDTIMFIYVVDRWVELTRSLNS